MAEVQQNDDLPIAVRRKRRSSLGPILAKESHNTKARGRGIDTPPSTPRRARKKVRFSDPGPPITEDFSTGLTPSLRRASINCLPSASTTPRRRQPTPASRRSRFENDVPLSGAVQFAPLRQVLEGRVKRRLQRNRLSEEVNRIEYDNRRKSKARRAELERLRNSLAEKDREMEELRDAMDVASQIGDEQVLRARMELHDDRVRDLESEIGRLKDELQAHEGQTTMHDWTNNDPFDDDNDFPGHNYDDFDDGSVLQGTPEPLHILSPPESVPDTPTRSYMQEGTQATFDDLEKTGLYSQLSALQHEVDVLSNKLESKKIHQESLSAKLAPIVPAEDLDVALDSVLEKLALSQASAKHAAERFDALKAEIGNLGFSNDTEKTIANIASQFRQARIELEHLTPGENTESFENDKILSMLVGRVRTLLNQVKTRDADIDQYHEQEILLRQQLGASADALTALQEELVVSKTHTSRLEEELKLSIESNEKLKAALEGYRAEVAGLEKLIETMESANTESEAQLRREMAQAIGCLESDLEDEKMRHETTKAEAETSRILLAEFQARLASALEATETIKSEMGTTVSQLELSALEREQEHSTVLASRDVRVTELCEEVERVNESLIAAQQAISKLQTENKDISAQANNEQMRARAVVHAMRDQLMGAMNIGIGFLGEKSTQPESDMEHALSSIPNTPSNGPLRFLDSGRARKSGSKKRRYDSGLGLLEEEEDEMMEQSELIM